MKTIKFFYVMAFLAITGALFSSCSPDSDEEKGNSTLPTPPATIVGEWLEDLSSGNVQAFGTNYYKEDGTADFLFGYVESPNSMYFNYSGSYTLEGSSLTQRYVNPITGDNTTETLEIVSLDKYTLVTKSSISGSESTDYRIVSDYQMNVGDSKTFDISSYDASFTANSFYSTNESVARVSTSGNISAIKRGTAFICGKSESGTAVIRVTVNDSNNVIDDFLSFVGGSIDDVTQIYGNNYIEESSPIVKRTYGLLDDMIEKVEFFYYSNTVLGVTAYLRPDVNSDAIITSFGKKYSLYDDSKYVPVYSTTIDGQEYHVVYYISDGMITYMPYIEQPPKDYNFSEESFKQYDNLIMMGTADVAAKAFGITLSAENLENGWFDIEPGNEIFSEVSVLFNEDPDDEDFMKINTVMLTSKSGISQEDIEQWYADNYTATGDTKNPYQSSTTPVYYISFKQSGSHIVVYYKFRKNK